MVKRRAVVTWLASAAGLGALPIAAPASGPKDAPIRAEGRAMDLCSVCPIDRVSVRGSGQGAWS